MQLSVSEETYREFLKAFQLFRDPAGLAASPLMSSPLVREQMATQSALLPHQALQACFTDVLAMVADQNQDYADLLQGRFWEGKQIEEMLMAERPLPMSKRTFSNYQRSAIQAFAFLFLQAETNRQSLAPTELPTEPSLAPAPAAVTEAAVLLNPSNEPLTLSTTTAVAVTMQEARLAVPRPLVIDAQARRVITIPLPVTPGHRRIWFSGGLLLLFALLVSGFLWHEWLFGFGAAIVPETLFVDDFEAGDAKWNSDSADWAIQVDGQGNHFYCVNTDGPAYTYALAGNTTWQDYTLQLDLKIISTAAGGSGNILWRVPDNFYPLYLLDFFAEADGNGFALEREDGSIIATLDQSLNRLPTQVWLPLRVEVKGDRMQIFVGTDPLPTLQAVDPKPAYQGGIGLGAGFSRQDGSDHWEICFDNVKVTKNE